MLTLLINKLFQDGGLLRVRALLALGLTIIGGIWMLSFQVMPPPEYNVIWVATIMYYFGSKTQNGNVNGG